MGWFVRVCLLVPVCVLSMRPAGGAVPPGLDADVPHGCLSLWPHTASAAGITDDGGHVDVDVAVLLDGVEREVAERAFAKANEAYAPVDVALRAASFEQVTFTSPSVGQVLEESKRHVGGVRPAGADVVYTFIGREVEGLGQAMCIGGVEYPDEAFAAGSLTGPFTFAGLTFQKEANAKVFAHEVAHLLGTHHHYSDCGPGSEAILNEDRETAPCSLMAVDVALIQLRLSPVDALMVRAHAVEYASP